MRKIALILVWAIVFLGTLCGNEVVLTQDEFVCLEHFFRILIGESEGGYILLDKKPVCDHGVPARDNFQGPSTAHRTSTLLREGAHLWQRKGLGSASGNIILIFYKNSDPTLTCYRHIVLINKKLFLEEVEKNLSLFQYILGPEVTPERLLAQITDSESSFLGTLKGNKVLIGILLGFGAENSLFVSHLEYMEEALLSKENFPFKRRFDSLSAASHVYRHLLLGDRTTISEKSQNPTPSFGFKSLGEEVSTLQSKLTCSSLALANEPAPFMFGRIKDEENEKKVRDLEVAQKKIISILQDENFLKNVLSYFNLTAKISPESGDDQLSLHIDEIAQLPSILADELNEQIEEESPSFKAHFIEGIKAAEEKRKSSLQDVNTLKYQQLKSLLKIKKELVETENYFKTIASGPIAYREIRPSWLYTQIKEEGKGVALANEKKILIHIAVTDSKDNLLMDTWRSGIPEWMDRAELIPGLNLGISGMTKGEVREILIHPALGYGIYTTASKGSYLVCQVGLIDFAPGSEEFIPSDFDYASEMTFPPNLVEQVSQLEEKVAFEQGFAFWDHYKKENLVRIEPLLSALEHANNSAPLPKDQAARILQKLHWIIYSRSN